MFAAISRAIDVFNTKQGEVTSLLVLPLLAVVIYEVFMRYVFNSPTIWGFEVTTFLYGLHYMFGYAYTDVQDGHVRVDIFSARMSPRGQAILAIITNLVIFLPVMTCLTIWTCKFGITSLRGLDVNSTSWAPPIYPIKLIMAACFLFLLRQGVSNLIKDVKTLSAAR